jgi:transposase|tara:strand:- start:15142 stop:15717 length:576 start_codon:yes stop_codon:yes gene_type:complete
MGINSKDEIQERAVDLHYADWKTSAIARELGVHAGTVRRWFKKRGIPAKKNGLVANEKPTSSGDELADAIEENLENMTDEAVMRAKHDARIVEDETMMELAEMQHTPADKYQHYIAAAGIRLLRDHMKNLKGPKSVRELSELDQLIRRNLGLNSKTGGGGASKMQIDISILNNKKADRGNGTVIDLKTDDQ